MRLNVERRLPWDAEADVLVVTVPAHDEVPEYLAEIDRRLDGALTALRSVGAMQGKLWSARLLPARGMGARFVLVLGVGDGSAIDRLGAQRLGSVIVRKLAGLDISSLAVHLPDELVGRGGAPQPAVIELATRGLHRLPARVAAGGHRRLLGSRRQQLAQLMSARVAGVRARIEAGDRALGHLGPTRVLQRGYSITFLEGATTPLKDAARVHGGQSMITRLARGEVRSLVSRTTIEPPTVVREMVHQPTLFDDATETGAEPVDDGATDD